VRQRDPGSERQALTRKQKWQFALGILNANVLAALLITITIWLGASSGGSGFYGVAATVLIPLLMGFMAALTWRELPLSGKNLALGALINMLVGMAMAYFFLHEGTVCLVMAFPLLYLMIWLSTLAATKMMRPKPGPLSVSVIPVLLGALLYDCWNPAKEYQSAVTTSVLVQAPAQIVFPHTVAFPPIKAPATSVINSAGLPWPVETTADAARVGAGRRCVFSGNLVIGEKITELIPGKSLTFTITEQPHYPEFTDHGKLLKGRITVTDNGNGTTTLTGTSWYTLRVRPLWYFGFWADGIIHGVHNRVFAHIKEISEKEAAHGRDLAFP
jgi:hypothetical protein